MNISKERKAERLERLKYVLERVEGKIKNKQNPHRTADYKARLAEIKQSIQSIEKQGKETVY